MIVDAPAQVAGVSNVHHNVEKKVFTIVFLKRNLQRAISNFKEKLKNILIIVKKHIFCIPVVKI